MAIAILEAGYFMKYSGSSALLKRILENFCNNANLWAIDPSVLLPRGHDRLPDNSLQRHRRLLRAHPPASAHAIPPSGHDRNRAAAPAQLQVARKIVKFHSTVQFFFFELSSRLDIIANKAITNFSFYESIY
jgi:hypothetical protein